MTQPSGQDTFYSAMHHHYSDITDKLGIPQWYDEHAVPRYCVFGPDEVANIYASQIALLEIHCQECGTPFLVAMSWDPFRYVNRPSLKEEITDKSVHWGDPPNIGCCCAGATMNCIDKRVLEFWERSRFEWHRVRELEINLDSKPTSRLS